MQGTGAKDLPECAAFALLVESGFEEGDTERERGSERVRYGEREWVYYAANFAKASKARKVSKTRERG